MPAVLKIRKLRLRGARRTGAEPEAPLASQHGRGGMLLVALAGVSPLGSLVKGPAPQLVRFSIDSLKAGICPRGHPPGAS